MHSGARPWIRTTAVEKGLRREGWILDGTIPRGLGEIQEERSSRQWGKEVSARNINSGLPVYSCEHKEITQGESKE